MSLNKKDYDGQGMESIINELRFRTIFENAAIGIALVDMIGRPFRSNPALQKMLGYTEEELHSMDFSEFTHPEDVEKDVEQYERMIEGEIDFYQMEKRYLTKDNSVIWGHLTVSLIRDTKGSPIYGIGMVEDITKRKSAEEELRNSKELLEKTFLSLDNAVFILDNKKPPQILDCNPVSEKMFGYKREEMVGMTTDFLHINNESLLNFQKVLYPAIEKDGYLSSFEFQMKNRNGDIFPTEHSVLPFKGSSGIRTGWVSTVSDITERKRNEDKIKVQNKFLNTIIESIPYPFYVIDAKDYSIKLANSAVGQMGNWKNSTCHALSHKSDIPCKDIDHICPLEIVKKTKQQVIVEHVHCREDGVEKIFEVHGYPILDESGIVAQMIEFSKEITAEKEVEETKAFLAGITENSHDAIASLDTNATFTSWNKGAEEIFGYTRDEILGKSFGYLVPDELKSTCFGLLDEVQKEGFLKGIESERITKVGKRIYVEMTISVLNDIFGEQIGYTYILRDITDRKTMENKLFERQIELTKMGKELMSKNKALEESNVLKDIFSDVIRHDLLNPIGTVNLYVNQMLEDQSRKEDSDLLFIKKELSRAILLIDSATQLSKIENSKEIELEYLDLKKIIESAIDTFEYKTERAGIQIECEIEKSLPIIANRIIEEIFINLVSNAIKYAQEGKRIILKAEDAGEMWRIRIIDFGDGIKDEYKEIIFDRFSRREKSGVHGTGLGLAIVKKIVEIHKGKVWVEDNPGGGAVFIVELPKDPTKKRIIEFKLCNCGKDLLGIAAERISIVSGGENYFTSGSSNNLKESEPTIYCGDCFSKSDWMVSRE